MKRITPSDYNFDKVHMIGNGPSADLFDHSDGLVISTHVPLITSDIILTNRAYYYGYYGLPTISIGSISIKSTFAKKVFKPSNVSSIVRHYAIHDWCIYSLDEVTNEAYQTGHRGYLWVQHQKPKEVHMWGFDTIWNDSDYLHKDSFTEIKTKRRSDKPNTMCDNEYQIALQEATARKQLWHQILQKNTEVHK